MINRLNLFRDPSRAYDQILLNWHAVPLRAHPISSNWERYKRKLKMQGVTLFLYNKITF